MDFGLSEEQQQLKESARAFLNGECPTTFVRKVMASDDGYPRELYDQIAKLGWTGLIVPEKFGGEPPFDRHDWYVARTTPDGSVKQVRYVIDYYSGGVQATGEPVFYLDIRPALDTPSAAVERVMRWGGDIWHRASGGAAREAASRNADKNG